MKKPTIHISELKGRDIKAPFQGNGATESVAWRWLCCRVTCYGHAIAASCGLIVRGLGAEGALLPGQAGCGPGPVSAGAPRGPARAVSEGAGLAHWLPQTGALGRQKCIPPPPWRPQGQRQCGPSSLWRARGRPFLLLPASRAPGVAWPVAVSRHPPSLCHVAVPSVRTPVPGVGSPRITQDELISGSLT